MPHPLPVARIFEAGGQPFGDPEALFDASQQQDTSIRAKPPAVETKMHRLAGNRWQTGQNPRSFRHGGRELRCFW